MDFVSLIPPLTVGLLFLMLFRSISNLFKLKSSIRWIEGGKKMVSSDTIQETPIVVCIPMLREQRIVKETMNFFANLNADKNKTVVIIVTTEKERLQKVSSQNQIPKLCKAVIASRSKGEINEQFLGLFDSVRLDEACRLVAESPDLQSAIKSVNDFYDKLPTTNELANQVVGELSKRSNAPKFHVIHYPESYGVMAHQINFCAQWVKENLPDFKDSMFAVYNADSRPDPNTLIALDQIIHDYKQRYGTKLNLVQQSALFLLNFETFSKTFSGSLLRVCALMQSKWTLTHELDRLRHQSVYAGKKNHGWLDIIFKSKLSHCVGHGLFVRLHFLLAHPLPTKLMNEDLPFGYYRSCEREPIAPLPLLENAESPETVRSVINQKRVWFWPYLEYTKCRKKTLGGKEYKTRLEVEWLTAQGLMVGLIWFVQSVVFVLPLIVAIVFLSPLLGAFWLFVILVYWMIPLSLIEKRVLRNNEEWRSLRVMASDYWGIIPFLSIYSFGPWLATGDLIKKKFFGVTIRKKKTER